MCEIRFNVSQKDGKLEGMLNCIPSGIRTEVVKEALRYFLYSVRDNKVESDYIDASVLSEFKTNVKETSFSLEDVFRLIETRPAQTIMANTQAVTIADTPQPSIKDNPLIAVDEKEDEDEFDIDLDNDFDSLVDSIDVNDINIDGNW